MAFLAASSPEMPLAFKSVEVEEVQFDYPPEPVETIQTGIIRMVTLNCELVVAACTSAGAPNAAAAAAPSKDLANHCLYVDKCIIAFPFFLPQKGLINNTWRFTCVLACRNSKYSANAHAANNI